jgi:phosphate-selective porin OprO/OprP
VQADGRFFPGTAPAALGTSTFFLRRARSVTDITAWKYFTLRLTPDFGQGKVVLFDAYLDFRPVAQFGLRAGKTKPPIGLERIQSATDIRFIERGLPTNLVPNRDVGLQAIGDLAGGHLSYAVGVFNGVADLGNGDGDVTNDKDFAARLFLKVGGLGLGIGAGTGSEHGTVAATALPAYVTPGQQTVFRYRDSTIANGRRIRFAPQAYWYVGPLGVLGEYVVSAQDVTRTTSSARLTNRGWQVAASVFITGEKASFATVAPRHPFDPSKKNWGALEIAARYGELHPDEDAFPTFAVVGNSVTSAKAWGAGIAWHLAPAVRFAVNYERTNFTAGATTGNRTPENFLVVRVQQSF